jgi:hypothetical protein
MLRQGSTWGALSAPTVTFRDIKPRVFTKLGTNPAYWANTVTVSIQQKYSKNTAKTCLRLIKRKNQAQKSSAMYLVHTHVVFAAVLIQQSECCMIQQLQQYSYLIQSGLWSDSESTHTHTHTQGAVLCYAMLCYARPCCVYPSFGARARAPAPYTWGRDMWC